MKELLSNPAFLGLLGTIFGGAGVKILDKLLSNAEQRQTANAAMRAELRVEIDSLRKQLADSAIEEQRLEALVDKWQGSYYDLRDEKQLVVNELTAEKQKLVTELMIIMDRVQTLEKIVTTKIEEGEKGDKSN